MRNDSQKMKTIVNRYSRILAQDKIPYIELRSTAASLKWGGLYDLNKQWSTASVYGPNRQVISSGGHKEHRDGTVIDLSTDHHTVFGVDPADDKLDAKKALQRAITTSVLGHPVAVNFPFPPDQENPDTNQNHWHVYLDQVVD